MRVVFVVLLVCVVCATCKAPRIAKNDVRTETNVNLADLAALLGGSDHSESKMWHATSFCPPNRGVVVARSSHVPSYNGCGTSDIQIDVPEFTECCNAHDICYDLCFMKQAVCDSDFSNCMQKKCVQLALNSPHTYNVEDCTKAKQLFVSGVMITGRSAYLSSQENACKCARGLSTPGLTEKDWSVVGESGVRSGGDGGEMSVSNQLKVSWCKQLVNVPEEHLAAANISKKVVQGRAVFEFTSGTLLKNLECSMN